MVVQTAFFNHLNRVADGVGIELDYPTGLPAMARVDRAPLPRPERAAWPRPSSVPTRLSLEQRAATGEAFARWSDHVLERDAPLSRRDRAVVRRAVAGALCHEGLFALLEFATPAGGREEALSTYADTLTRSPWRVDSSSLAPLRAAGLDDEALLDVIALTSFQNAASRIELALAAS